MLSTGHQTIHAQCYTIPHHATYWTPNNRCTMLHYTTLRYIQDTRQLMHNTTLYHTTLWTGQQASHQDLFSVQTIQQRGAAIPLYYAMLHYTTLQYRHCSTLHYVQDSRLHTRICSLSKPSSNGEQLFQYTDMQSSLTNWKDKKKNDQHWSLLLPPPSSLLHQCLTTSSAP